MGLALASSLACSVGALANVGIADYLFEHRTRLVPSALAGILVGAVWNYAVTAVYTWKKPRQQKAAQSAAPRGAGSAW